MHENEPVGGTHFHINGFARRLVLTQRQKATQRWPIKYLHHDLRFFAGFLLFSIGYRMNASAIRIHNTIYVFFGCLF